MRFSNLDDWLHWQESLNPAEIDLGLERVEKVLTSMGHARSFSCPLITVAGTNGKGSVVAMLESIAISAGLKTACYTSPHIIRYNERIRFDAQPIDDEALCHAFQRVDDARGDVALTYFEFGTLAAIDLIMHSEPDLVVLEVGLGGRLDAVNVMDADIAILTTVAIDHVDWLGDDREVIGREKAGVFRRDRLAVTGDDDVPDSVRQHASAIGCDLQIIGKDFHTEVNEAGTWCYRHGNKAIPDLPAPALSGDYQYINASLVVSALEYLFEHGALPGIGDIETLRAAYQAIGQTSLSGRYQQVHVAPDVFVDVAHNVQAANSLASILRTDHVRYGRTWAVFAMMADKDIASVLQSLDAEVDQWCFCALEDVPRAATVDHLTDTARRVLTRDGSAEFSTIAVSNQCTMDAGGVLYTADDVASALEFIMSRADECDRIIIAGSFYTVSAALSYYGQ